MDAATRIETALERAIARNIGLGSPPRLTAAVRYAVFPGGARIRPRLCVAVSQACAGRVTADAVLAAVSIEFLHCASLVHDDLPCFDDAAMRRGRPSLHRAFGEPLAILAGDALIVLAFQALAGAGDASRTVLPMLLRTIARGAGMPGGIVAGQAWECEPEVELSSYHRAKTGGLFAAAAVAGAVASGAEGSVWHAFGEYMGEAYQVADDLRDVASDDAELGKPVGKDAALGRPSAVAQLGVAGALQRLEQLVTSAIDAVPACAGAAELRAHVSTESSRLVPRKLARPAA